MKLLHIVSVFVFSAISFLASAQEKEEIVKATEFEIPNSGAFTLLGSTPKDVSTPGFTKDIKFDYFLNKFSLKPNIAFEFQPFWLFGLKNTSLEKYKNLSAAARSFATMNFSLGTVQDNDSVNRIAYSVKFSFGPDPMMDQKFTDGIDGILKEVLDKRTAKELVLTQEKTALRNRRWAWQDSLNANTTNSYKKIANDSIAAIDIAIETIVTKLTLLNSDEGDNKKALDKVLKEYVKNYEEANWQRFKMDIGIGKVDQYSDPDITHLQFKNKGFGFWANPSIGFSPGKAMNKNASLSETNKLIFTGMAKYIHSDSSDIEFYGGNIKYGTARLNLFCEFTYEKSDTATVKSIGYGGSYRIGDNKLLDFGIRTKYDNDFKFRSLVPVIAFKWKFVNDLFKQ